MMVEGLDLAFLSITLITRLSNVVIRRMYLSSMVMAVDELRPSEMEPATREFWKVMAHEMVANAEELLSQVESFFGMRSPHLGFPPIMMSCFMVRTLYGSGLTSRCSGYTCAGTCRSICGSGRSVSFV